MTQKQISTVSATQEDYLETILRLRNDTGVARVRDIAHALSVHKSTVTAALKGLSLKGLVNHAPYEMTTLSVKGRKMAEEISTRHDVIQHFLSDILLLDEETAKKNACRMEHVLDRDALDRFVAFVEFARTRAPRHNVEPRSFAAFLRRAPTSGRKSTSSRRNASP